MFREGHSGRGIFVLCEGRVKLSVCSQSGKRLTLRIAGPGEVLGLSSSLSGGPHQVTAETLGNAQVAVVKRKELLRFLRDHREAYLQVVNLLSRDLHVAYDRVRSIGLGRTRRSRAARGAPPGLDRTGPRGGVRNPADHRVLCSRLEAALCRRAHGNWNEPVASTFAEIPLTFLSRSRGLPYFSWELDHFPTLFRGHPLHFLVKCGRNIKLDHLCHGPPPIQQQRTHPYLASPHKGRMRNY